MDWKVLVGSKVLLLILLSTSVKSDEGEKRVVCYYTNWSVYRPGTAKFSPQNINPYLCTHLIYAFGGFTKDNTLKPFDKYQDIDKGGYAKFTGLKTYNKDLKTLLAIGGWNEASSRFSPMVADPHKRRKFVKNVVKFLRQNHFDGLDLDWEYPAFRDGGKPKDRENYASFVQELREEFEKEASKTGRPRLLLTMAVPAGIEYIDKGYDIPKLDEYLDFINLLSYDYHSAYEPAVNHHAPLRPIEEDNEYNYDNELTIDYTINHLIKSGATPGKIVVGIPTYGRSYTLFNEDATDLGSPADGPGAEGDATREKGYLAYYEICKSVQKDDWIVEKPNPKAMGPYAYKENQWVGYDDEDIVREKAKYVNQKKLGGIMFWSIDNDDFRGECHGRPYPLIEAAKEALLEENEKQKPDERPNAISSRKRNRITESSKSDSNTRKSNRNSNRKNTISRSVTTKRPSSKTRSRSNTKTRTQQKNDDESDDENAENSENVETTRAPNKPSRPQVTNKNRFRARQNTNDRVNRKKQVSESTTTQRSRNNKITTPEPPTTPDPGSDFKCEDEGFFPHPRDCKKYFWCLDSGPSGLGIVANQFTCPSGLVFNKLADSCDYPRNVVCPKPKSKDAPSTTTQRTTTERDEVSEEDDEDEEYEDEEDDVKEVEEKVEEKPKRLTTTTARPLLYKTISRSRPTTTSTTTTTTTTTTSAPFSTAATPRLSDDISEEEQDPRVIKELIDLIKKAGGIEQLEKQLAFQEKGESAQGTGHVTPATISKSLYDRVLNRQSGKNNLFKIPTSRLSTTRKTEEVKDTNEDEEQDEKIENDRSRSKVKFVNGPGRSQFEGLDEVPEVKSLRRSNKPKYVTIERHSSSTTSTKIDDELIEGESDDDEEEDNEEIASSEEKLISNVPEETSLPTQRSTPGYVNIRRTRPTTTTEISRNDNDIKAEDTIDDQPTPNLRQHTFRSTEQTQKATQEYTTPKSRYISINRFRSTTVTPEKEVKQSTIESSTVKPVTTSEILEKELVKDEKTITVAGESGRISISPFTTETPSTARLFSDLLSTVAPTTPYIDEDFDSTHHTTKRVLEANATPNPNIIEDSVTESLLTIAPTESSTKETIAAVSQPRPFGFPRRTRPTSAAPTITDTTRSSLAGTEPTSRTKVSTSSRNLARSTTKAPRTRTRSRTRNHEKSISTVDDEHLSHQDEALQNNSELQENQKDTEPVSRSRSTIANRGSSRFRQSTRSRDSNIKKSNDDLEQTKNSERFSRRHRRPLKATTVSNESEDTRVAKITPTQSTRSRNFYRQSRIKLDQQTADTFDNKARTIKNVDLPKTSTTFSSTLGSTIAVESSTENLSTENLNIFTSEKEDTTEISQTETTPFIIEVTEPITSETFTSTYPVEEETFSLLESSLQTTVPSFLWNSYRTNMDNLNDEDIQTTIFDTTTESFNAKLSTIPSSSTATLSSTDQITNKILLRKRLSTTPTSVDRQPHDDVNSRRRKVVRRLRPLQDPNLNTTRSETTRGRSRYANKRLSSEPSYQNSNNENDNQKSTTLSLNQSVKPKSRYIRRKIVKSPGTPTTSSTPTTVINKRKHIFERYRPTSGPLGKLDTLNDENDYNSADYNHDSVPKDTSKDSKSSQINSHLDVPDIPQENIDISQTPEYRKSRTRFRIKNNEPKEFENFTPKNKVTSRYLSRTTSTTESSIQETLVPTKKFDYFADAIKRANQLQRTTPKFNNDNGVLVSTSKPLVTRLVTSIVESATTERQKISIKKKYSSLTSFTYIPKTTTVSPYSYLQRNKEKRKNQLLNEISPGFSTEQSVEWSTLPIESEFSDKKFTTESSDESSSTIEIESVFSNLIGH
ncbi:mucin-5AC isoform X1 [Nasonia vitripennis]|uniref:chitinase n=1 Tax=Nasonia vitripennis TaxID=7425 RepID=A0A7M7IST7_NASVI|nr:mucin-5AC isoform X1 [Nasonia vitripennis]